MNKACLFVFAYGDVKHQTATSVTAEITATPLLVHYVAPDAAIDRARAQAATMFLLSVADVMVMVDRDIAFCHGDVAEIVRVARETKGICGGMVSKKANGLGWGTRLPDDSVGEIRTKQVIDMPKHSYVGGAFMAIHRDVFDAIAPTLTLMGAGGWFPFFEPMALENPAMENGLDHLSEDWSICHRAREAGCKVSTSMWPLTQHIGETSYSVFDGVPDVS